VSERDRKSEGLAPHTRPARNRPDVEAHRLPYPHDDGSRDGRRQNDKPGRGRNRCRCQGGILHVINPALAPAPRLRSGGFGWVGIGELGLQTHAKSIGAKTGRGAPYAFTGAATLDARCCGASNERASGVPGRGRRAYLILMRHRHGQASIDLGLVEGASADTNRIQRPLHQGVQAGINWRTAAYSHKPFCA